MENVMTNGFTELSANEMDEINGGWSITLDLGIVKINVTDQDLKNLGNWYTEKYVPAAERFGARAYDYASVAWAVYKAIA